MKKWLIGFLVLAVLATGAYLYMRTQSEPSLGERLEQITEDHKDNEYREIRAFLMASGFIPVAVPHATGPDESGEWEDGFCAGDEKLCETYPEVLNCSGTGSAPCQFAFHDKNSGRYVIVETYGETLHKVTAVREAQEHEVVEIVSRSMESEADTPGSGGHGSAPDDSSINDTVTSDVPIDPYLKEIVRSSDGSDYDVDTHSFYRLILRNTEHDPCLTLEQVTVYAETNPRILKTERICEVLFPNDRKERLADFTGVDYADFTWDKTGIAFSLDIYEGSPYECRIRDLDEPIAHCLLP